MKRPLLVLATLGLVAAVPGPCSFDTHPELDCADDGVCPEGFSCGPDGFCKDNSSSDSEECLLDPAACEDPCVIDPDSCDDRDDSCESNADCTGFTINGEQAICRGDGRCGLDTSCPPHQDLGQPGDFCAQNEDCVLVEGEEGPFNEGRCRRRSSSPVALGGVCSRAPAETSPCAPGLLCWPFSDDEGVCLKPCQDEQLGDCPSGYRCTRSHIVDAVDVPPICVPECNAAARDCPAQYDACITPGEEQSCLDDRAVCVFATCTSAGCRDQCTDAACGAGEFCVTERFTDRCARSSSFDLCTGPGVADDDCRLDEPASCANGFACVPLSVPRCVAQTSTPIADGEPCTFVEGGNPCEKGSFCTAPNGDITEGICQKFCTDTADCEQGQECVRGNIGYADAQPLGDVKVCADPCDPAVGGCPTNLQCDVDDGGACAAGPGACLVIEANIIACAGDADCALVNEDMICDGSISRCVFAADQCT